MNAGPNCGTKRDFEAIATKENLLAATGVGQNGRNKLSMREFLTAKSEFPPRPFAPALVEVLPVALDANGLSSALSYATTAT
jgi:hypothetical protein